MEILIVKCLAISKLIFNFTVLKVPKEIINKINKILYNFIWNKVDRIKRNTLIADYGEGGLRMVDVQSKIESLKAAWIPRILNDKGHILYYFLNDLRWRDLEIKNSR